MELGSTYAKQAQECLVSILVQSRVCLVKVISLYAKRTLSHVNAALSDRNRSILGSVYEVQCVELSFQIWLNSDSLWSGSHRDGRF